jgi:hypothetical protein
MNEWQVQNHDIAREKLLILYLVSKGRNATNVQELVQSKIV